MNKSIQLLAEIAGKPEKRFIGLMSGTSLDGVDIALCRIRNTGEKTAVELERFTTGEYPRDLRDQLSAVLFKETVPLQELCLMHSWLGEYYANLVLEALQEWDIEPREVDCIASHGQTAYHAPKIKHQRHGMPNSTLQIGEGDHIARNSGILTISDFRQKHTTVGGEGAPMVSLVDRMLFTDKTENRCLLNIGGISNFSFIPSKENGNKGSFMTTDTGPGNILINAAVRKYFNRNYDVNGTIAASGTVNADLLGVLKQHPFFDEKVPKSTGPEMFNLGWVEKLQKKSGLTDIQPEDLVATLTWFSADTIADQISVLGEEWEPVIYLSGGGRYNNTLIKWLERLLEDHPVMDFEEIGFNSDAKEAVSFAVLANETLSGDGFLVKPKKRAERRVNFGKISFPV